MCKAILNGIYNWAVASGCCDVSALRSAECGFFWGGRAALLGKGHLWSQSWHWAASLGSEPSASPAAKERGGSSSKLGVDEINCSWRRLHPHCSWNPCWEQVCSSMGAGWVKLGASTGCRALLGLGGLGLHPGLCGFTILPPLLAFRRFGELCAR